MLKEFVIICAAAFIWSPLSVAAENALPESPLHTSVKASKTDQRVVAQLQDNDAVPSESSYQSVVPPRNYLPSSSRSYEVKAAIVKTLPGNVPVNPDAVSGQFIELGHANQPTTAVYSTIVASDSAAQENNNIIANNDRYAEPIRRYYSVPVAVQTVAINQATSNYPNPAVQQYYAIPLAKTNPSSSSKYVINPAITYANNAARSREYYGGPIAANKVSIESHGAVNLPNPSPYAIQQVQPKLAFTAENLALVKYSVNHVTSPVTQYAAPRVAYAINPAVPIPTASKKITVEAFNSVTAHPPASPKYTTAPVLIRYASAPNSVAKPVPIPVIYQPSIVETKSLAAQPTAATYVQAPLGAQPVLVNHGDGTQRYNPVSIPRVHAETFVEKVYSPVGPASLSPGSLGNSNTRATLYSSAADVSRFSFNGFGTSYGW